MIMGAKWGECQIELVTPRSGVGLPSFASMAASPLRCEGAVMGAFSTSEFIVRYLTDYGRASATCESYSLSEGPQC